MIRPWLLLAWHETADVLTRPALHAFVISLALLSGFAVFVGLQDVLARRDDHARLLQAQSAAELRRVPLTGWEADERLRALRPPESGAALVAGNEAAVPSYWDFGPSGVEWGAGYRPGQVSEGGVIFDLAGLVLILGGLAAILLGAHRTVAKRRDRTWFALTNLPVPGSFVGTATVTSLVAGTGYSALAPVVAAALVVRVNREPSLVAAKTDLFWMVVSFVGPIWLYFAFMSLVGVGLGLAARREGTALLRAIVAWAAVVILTPALPLAAARLLGGTVPRNAMEFSRAQAYANRVDEAEVRLGERVLELANGTTDPEVFEAALERHAERIAARWNEHAVHARRAAVEIEAPWWQVHEEADRIEAWVALVAPGFQLTRALEHLASTGPAMANMWQEAVESHQTALSTALFDDRPRINVKVRPAGEGISYVYYLDRRPPSPLPDLPRFDAPVRALADRLRSAAGPVAVLAIYLVGTSLWVGLSFRRVASSAHSWEVSSTRP